MPLPSNAGFYPLKCLAAYAINSLVYQPTFPYPSKRFGATMR